MEDRASYNQSNDEYEEEMSEEFEELDQISRVALLIDDLNNEDPLAQQNSIEKLGTIVQVLGPHRCVDELIPMLTELIDRIDNNSELLMHLAIELGNLTEFLGPKLWAELCKPLELIWAADENIVREKAEEALLKVCVQLEHDKIWTEFYELVERLSKGELYSMRIASCYLLAKTYERTKNEDIRDKLFNDLSVDDTPMVRRAIAINLGNFAKVLDYPIDIVLKAYRALLSDKQDAVKIEALKNSCILARILINNGDLDKAENDIIISCKKASEETSWRLRFAVAEILSELVHIVGKDLSDKHIKSVVEKLLGDSEAEVRSEIITKVIETVEIIKPDQVLDKLILLIQDPSQHVRESLAEWMCKISEHIETDLFVEKALSGMCQLMKDTATEVRVSILNNIEVVSRSIGKENTEKSIIPALLELTTDKQWRVRYGIAQFFPKFAKIFGKQLFFERLEKIWLDFLVDNVYKNREQSMQNIVDLKKILGEDWFVRICKEKIREFSRSEKWAMRIQAIFMTRIISKDIDLDILNKDIIPVIIGLKDDIVPNIRFNVAKILDELSNILSKENIFIGRSALNSMKNNDIDDDVKYFATKTLKNSVFKE